MQNSDSNTYRIRHNYLLYFETGNENKTTENKNENAS